MKHELEITDHPYPGDISTVYFGRCTCGNWESGKDYTRHSVERRHTAHAEAKQELSKAEVTKRLGWGNPNNVSVARLRTRNGTALVPFPEPDGTTPEGRPYWYAATIDAYVARVDTVRGRARPITGAQVARMRRLRDIDGLSLEEIAVKLGIGKTTVSRHLHKPTTDEETT